MHHAPRALASDTLSALQSIALPLSWPSRAGDASLHSAPTTRAPTSASTSGSRRPVDVYGVLGPPTLAEELRELPKRCAAGTLYKTGSPWPFFVVTWLFALNRSITFS